MGNVVTVGPDEILVVSGGIGNRKSCKYVIGGWAWVWKVVSMIQKISLNTITLNPICKRVETSFGVPVTVSAIVQVKIKKESLNNACSNFLGRKIDDIKNSILATLEGHLRSILGTMTVEQIYHEREAFNVNVLKISTGELSNLGFEILSFNIKDVYDEVHYLDSLGITQTAITKQVATVGSELEITKAIVEESHRYEEWETAVQIAETNIADAERSYAINKLKFKAEVHAIKAEAELAYELEFKAQDKTRVIEMRKVEIAQRRKQIELEEIGISLKERELEADVRLEAKARAAEKTIKSEGQRDRDINVAEAKAKQIQRMGEAEAAAIRLVGEAEAEGMRVKAEAYKQYGRTAMLSQTLQVLPAVAAEMAAPLGRTKEIVIVSNSRRGCSAATGGVVSNAAENISVSGQITQLFAELPPSVNALTGVDLTKVLQNFKDSHWATAKNTESASASIAAANDDKVSNDASSNAD